MNTAAIVGIKGVRLKATAARLRRVRVIFMEETRGCVLADISFHLQRQGSGLPLTWSPRPAIIERTEYM